MCIFYLTSSDVLTYVINTLEISRGIICHTLSFFSLMFLFPWCFPCCEIPWSFWVFSAYFPGFLRVRKVRTILGIFEVFLGIFERTKEKKDRVKIQAEIMASHQCRESL